MIVLFGTFILLILIKMPIAFTLFISSIVYMLVNDMSVTLAIQRIAAGPDSFPLLAVPGFILAGAIMNTGGVTQRIFGFASKCLGHLPGGLGHANILASIIFAGMSGSAIADAGGLGAVELKAMKDAGYDEDFSLAVTGASSTIGPIIPPSIPAVLYGVTAGVSIGRLFAGGFIPGFIMGGALSVFVHFYGKRKGYARTKKASFKELWDSLVAAFFPLITPLIIVGGIVLGIFTPTEAAMIVVLYAVILAFAYKTITLKDLVGFLRETFKTTVSVMFIISGASLFAYILTSAQIPQQFAQFFLNTFHNKYTVLLVINLLLLVVGTFMDTSVAIVVLTPVLMPVITNFGIDPVHFGIIMILNLMIGLLTPPVGMVLFVLTSVSKVPLEKIVKATMPFMAILVVVLIAITYIPAIVLFVPELLY